MLYTQAACINGFENLIVEITHPSIHKQIDQKITLFHGVITLKRLGSSLGQLLIILTLSPQRYLRKSCPAATLYLIYLCNTEIISSDGEITLGKDI